MSVVPRPSSRVRRVIGVVLAGSIAMSSFGACGGSDAKASESKPIAVLPTDLFPATMHGLEVKPEEITASIKEQERSYLEAIGLYSFRKNDLLEATLQVSKFNDQAQYRKASFRQAIIGQIGTTVPKQARMGDHTVYVTSAKKQTVVVWFTGRYALVYSTREDFPQGRSLLRSLLEVKLP